MNQNLYVNETKLHTRTHFETEVKGNSEIACSQTLFSMASMGGREGGREGASERASERASTRAGSIFSGCEFTLKDVKWALNCSTELRKIK